METNLKIECLTYLVMKISYFIRAFCPMYYLLVVMSVIQSFFCKINPFVNYGLVVVFFCQKKAVLDSK